ncbi:MAG: nuclear transport factor 2 family protein [Alsobacter sp.]
MSPFRAHACARAVPSGAGRRAVLAHGLAVAAGALALGRTRPAAAASQGDDLVATYRRFVTAQNAGDLATVRSLFTETPRFLWVSDGQSIWGRDAAVERMALFRQSEVWRVTPDLQTAVTVALDERTAYLHLSLVLAIGPKEPGPDHLPFLVSLLGTRAHASEPFAIAALFTTARKTP